MNISQSAITPFGIVGMPPIRARVDVNAIREELDYYVDSVNMANSIKGFRSGAFPDIVIATVKNKVRKRGATFAHCIHFGKGNYQLVFRIRIIRTII